MKKRSVIRIIEFFIVGLIFGVTEDILAIKLSTGAPINWDTLLIAFLVALPFAIFSELIVDHPKFRNKFFKRDKD